VEAVDSSLMNYVGLQEKKNLSWNGGLRQPVTTNDRSVGAPRRRVGGDVDGVEHRYSHSPVLKGTVWCYCSCLWPLLRPRLQLTTAHHTTCLSLEPEVRS
jgi:hypothetical protein